MAVENNVWAKGVGNLFAASTGHCEISAEGEAQPGWLQPGGCPRWEVLCGYRWQRSVPSPALQVQKALGESTRPFHLSLRVFPSEIPRPEADFWVTVGNPLYYNDYDSILTQTGITFINTCQRKTSERFSSPQRKGSTRWWEPHQLWGNACGEPLTTPFTVYARHRSKEALSECSFT